MVIDQLMVQVATFLRTPGVIALDPSEIISIHMTLMLAMSLEFASTPPPHWLNPAAPKPEVEVIELALSSLEQYVAAVIAKYRAGPSIQIATH